MNKDLLLKRILVVLCAGVILAFHPTTPKPANNAFYKTAEKVDPDLEKIRLRIVNDLLEQEIDPNNIEHLVKTQNADGSWPGINYVDTTKTGFQHRVHLENMFDLARSFKKDGSPYRNNESVKKTVSNALDFWIAHDFICENWWWNEMGTPNWMINTLLLLDSSLTDKQRGEGARIASRASLTGFGARAGGDFVPIAGMVCKQGLFKRDTAILKHALDVMADQIVITRGRGIKPDLSFNHRVDNVTSIHTYGTHYVSSFTYWSVKTAGTKFKLPDSAVNLLADFYLDGVAKSMAYSLYPDPGAKNRDLSRKGTLDPQGEGPGIPETFLQSTNYRKKEMQDIINIRKNVLQPSLSWNKYFWSSSYFAHQRKNYFASVRMHSNRQNNMEEPYNEEGLMMHHIADGANFISRTGREYVDVFPVWDWQKIPGTTVVQRATMPPAKQIAKKGLREFVGGVSNGDYGAAAFDFASVHDPLTAKKAWFFFDDQYVCLGTAIQSSADDAVATTINQCLLNGNVVVKDGSDRKQLQRGEHNLQNVSWIYHDSVGYVFPGTANIHVSNTTATGSWRQINHQDWATDDAVSKDLFTAWFNHGTKPAGAAYAYIVIPSVSEATLNQKVQNSPVKILANTKEMQAVKHTGLQVSQVVFYEAGSINLGQGLVLKAAQPCLVLIKTKGKNINEIAVSDPAQKLTSLQLQVNVPVNSSGKNYKAMYDNREKTSTLKIELPTEGYAGQSVVLKLSK